MLQSMRGRWWMGAALTVCLLVGACATFTGVQNAKRDRGLKFPHAKHKDQAACIDCHAAAGANHDMPTHDQCSACHTFDVDKPKSEECSFCHKNKDYTVTPRTKVLGAESKFSHAPHDAKEVACDKCHKDGDPGKFDVGGMMKKCLDCHTQNGAKFTECGVCHSQIAKDVRPTQRGGARIQHDSPEIWKRTHGRESLVDPKFCGNCHDQKDYCESCHRTEKPESHTVAWRRKEHGIRAMVDRTHCAVCHEEDSCIQCHRHSTPSSHHGGWGEPRDRHCVTCHFPAQQTECVVCHEKIDHDKARTSPHILGIYPGACGRCHPGGLPNHAPHPTNGTVGCKVCHM
jgi:hypothetical protein